MLDTSFFRGDGNVLRSIGRHLDISHPININSVASIFTQNLKHNNIFIQPNTPFHSIQCNSTRHDKQCNVTQLAIRHNMINTINMKQHSILPFSYFRISACMYVRMYVCIFICMYLYPLSGLYRSILMPPMYAPPRSAATLPLTEPHSTLNQLHLHLSFHYHLSSSSSSST